MPSIDPEKAARVWQRVRADTDMGLVPQDLLALIAEEQNDATTYLHLSRRFQGSRGLLLREMAQQEQTHAACLKGIYTLITGTRPVVRAQPVIREAPELTLRRCYSREMQCLSRYEAKSADAQYGQVFARLAQQEREHCRLILELLGSAK